MPTKRNKQVTFTTVKKLERIALNLFYFSIFWISSSNISNIAKLDQDLDLYLVYLEI